MEHLHIMGNVLDYGADPTGTKDSTCAFQTACDRHKQVYIPEGTYLIEQLQIHGSTSLFGAGDQATILKATNLTGNVLTFTGPGWHLRDMQFDAVADRVGGAYIYAQWKGTRKFEESTQPGAANFASISDIALTRQYVGIELDGCWSVNISNVTAFNGTDHTVAPGGSIICLGRTTYTGPIHIRGLSARTFSPERQPTAGIHMGHVDVVSISDTLLIYHNSDILITPGKDQFAALIQVTNCCFDTARHGMRIQPTEGGRVLRCGFSNTWFGAHSSDAMVIDGTDGVVTGLQWSNCMFLCNAGNGIHVSGKGVEGLYFSNSFISGNLKSGLVLSDHVKKVNWHGGAIGACHEMYEGNLGYGCHVSGSSQLSMALADLAGNKMGPHLTQDSKVQLFACENV